MGLRGCQSRRALRSIVLSRAVPAQALRKATIQRVSDLPPPPSRERPLEGGCLCGAVRFQITAPFSTALYCHCTHCQKRTGTGSSANARVPREGFRLLTGSGQLCSFQPPSGVPKLFCGTCGSALFSGDPFSDEQVAVRLGTLDGDPGIRPQFRQYLSSAVSWETVPEDGIERFTRSRSEGRAQISR